jgi:hypothetical protein
MRIYNGDSLKIKLDKIQKTLDDILASDAWRVPNVSRRSAAYMPEPAPFRVAGHINQPTEDYKPRR